MSAGDRSTAVSRSVCGTPGAAARGVGAAISPSATALVNAFPTGAVEELARDDVVAVALSHEDGQVGQPAGVGGKSGIERQRPVEDRRPGEA